MDSAIDRRDAAQEEMLYGRKQLDSRWVEKPNNMALKHSKENWEAVG